MSRHGRLSAAALARGGLAAMMTLVSSTISAASSEAIGLITPATQPIAIAGGVLMLPLSPAMGQALPQRVKITLQNGRAIEGIVAVMTANDDASYGPHWTADPRGLVLREIGRGERAAGEGVTTVLLARLPSDGSGTIRLGTQTLEPRWFTLPPAPARGGALEAALALDRPDPDSPLEHWRWVLLAESMGLAPPSRDRYGPVGAMAAEHVADLWRVGLERLRRADAVAARQCSELLTCICSDATDPARGVVSFAAWPVDPSALAALLALLLDDSLSDQDVAAQARRWVETQGPLLWWLEQSGREQMRFAMANRRDQPLLARFTWPGVDEVPLGELIPPRGLGQVMLERSGGGERALGVAGAAAATVLRVQAEQSALLLRCPPEGRIAEPPGVAIGPLRPRLTLAEVEGLVPRGLAPSRVTLAEVRRIRGHWEIFLDCRRPAIDPQLLMAQEGRLAQLARVEDASGIEAATLLIGRSSFEGGPRIALTIPEQGQWRLFKGAADAKLEVHRRSYGDRWLCRVVLPDSWLNPALEGPYLRLGLIRTHGDGDAIETAPNACAPWRLEPGRMEIDLSGWGDVP